LHAYLQHFTSTFNGGNEKSMSGFYHSLSYGLEFREDGWWKAVERWKYTSIPDLPHTSDLKLTDRGSKWR
jgi:hypothetical protein